MKTYSLTTRTRLGAIALAAVLLGVGTAFFVVGFFMLAALVVAGGLLGTGLAIYQRLRGGDRGILDPGRRRAAGLDPALEVYPESPASLGTLPSSHAAVSATPPERSESSRVEGEDPVA